MIIMAMFRRFVASFMLAGILAVTGGAAAQAYWFGDTHVYYSGAWRGGGKGHFYQAGWDGLRLEPTAADRLKDDMRTYIDARAYKSGQGIGGVQSARRADGGSTWYTMATKTVNAHQSAAGSYTEVKICMDRAWALDPCNLSAQRYW
ncbi:hypothetical protein BJH93_05610 [Kocuria polaris]|nr:hypothetical protein [Kocuria polaris]